MIQQRLPHRWMIQRRLQHRWIIQQQLQHRWIIQHSCTSWCPRAKPMARLGPSEHSYQKGVQIPNRPVIPGWPGGKRHTTMPVFIQASIQIPNQPIIPRLWKEDSRHSILYYPMSYIDTDRSVGSLLPFRSTWNLQIRSVPCLTGSRPMLHIANPRRMVFHLLERTLQRTCSVLCKRTT